ncbi:MAG TPA: YhjD/YihY/BrkB family envelope integrity protein [Spirochaetota bacterium]|nr:YhjD/YihY/BrkB family envelope integrity protein [Spirochaetota bacterium]HPV42430.1 YhjD/YihY/BrkB family envelope integrity protein [Spirochaetota bacterium]
MSKKATIKQTLQSLGSRAINIYHGEEIVSGIGKKIINAGKVLIVSTRKFIIDDCQTKASSITYTIILSLVPALTVGLTIYSFYYGVGENKKELFDRILLFLNENNIKLNIDPIFDAILGLIENAGKIGGISAAVMIFSATAMLRTLEKSMNDIWKIKKGRPMVLKIIYYWAALTLGPIMLAAGMTVATQLSIILSSPNYNAAYTTDTGRLWVVGEKSTILYSDPIQAHKKKISFTNLGKTSGRIDFDNQKVYTYEQGDKSFIEQEGRIEPLELSKTRYRCIQFIGNRGWIVGTNGILLITTDGGYRWHIRKFGTFNFNAIRMLTDTRGIIAAENGLVLTTGDGGETWSVEEWEGRPNLTAVAFFKDRGIITGSRGFILRTEDGGKKWEMVRLTAATRKNRPVNVNNAFFINENRVILVGNEGMILISENGGATWTSKKFRETNYYSAWFFNPNEGVAGGDDGTIIRTANGGDSWEEASVPAISVNALHLRDDKLWAVGNAGTVIMSKDLGLTWTAVKKGWNFGYTIINFLAPFVFIWLLFLLAYITLPYTRVPFKPAALGASFTAAVWVIFMLLFIVYVKGFATGTFAMYGALAAIPLFLLMVYASSVIVLYGAEVAYTLMHPHTYRSLKKAFGERDGLHAYYGLAVIHHVYRTFELGGGASSLKDIQKALGGGSEQAERYIRPFLEDRLIVQDSDGNYLPANSSENIMVNRVMDVIMNISLDMPVAPGKSAFRILLGRLFSQITASRRKVIGEMTLKELIDKE